MDDIRHVVILMQENRSFDHYFGTLNGVRGFDDRQALTFPNGDSVFRQPALSRTDGGFLLPYRMDSTKFNAQNADGLPHDWESGHDANNNGALNRWTSAKGEQSMGYLTREDIPYQYALADAFTLCDAYFCSLAGPTSPNRLYLWTGTVGPGRDGTTGPWIDNTPLPDNPVCDWTTYAERLSAANVTWRVYHTPGLDERHGNYEDNALEYFARFHTFDKDDPRYINAMTKWDLSAFDAHCKDGTLPTVSWLVSPYLFCEHPTASPPTAPTGSTPPFSRSSPTRTCGGTPSSSSCTTRTTATSTTWCRRPRPPRPPRSSWTGSRSGWATASPCG